MEHRSPFSHQYLTFVVGRRMTFLTSVLDLFAVLSFLASIQAIRGYQRRRGLPYPPGPQPLPIIGNLLHIPKAHSWLAYTQFSKIYGASISLTE